MNESTEPMSDEIKSTEIISQIVRLRKSGVDRSYILPEAAEKAHGEMAALLSKPGQGIIDSLTPRKAELWHMASALQGEAGELFDAVKRHVIYEKGIDMDNIVEELGDIEFYLARIRQLLGVDRIDTLHDNMEKLAIGTEEKPARYFDVCYSNAQAQARADKTGEVE